MVPMAKLLSPPCRDDDHEGHYEYKLGENLTPRFVGTFGRVLECWDREEREYVAVKVPRSTSKYRDVPCDFWNLVCTLKQKGQREFHFMYYYNFVTSALITCNHMEHSIRALRMRELEDIFVPVLQRCKSMAELKQVHARVVRYFLAASSFLVTRMVDVCDGCNEMGYASLLFRRVKYPNGFLFNVMIRGFTHNNMYSSAITTYQQMVWFIRSNCGSLVLPDRFTFPFILKCCAGSGYHELGKQVHGHLCKFGPSSHLLTENALIDMYAKGGCLLDACRVFDGMSERDPISWNAVISGHARLGQMKKAMALFDSMPSRTVVSWTAVISGYAGVGSFGDALLVFRSMQESGVEPDEISIVSVLPACAQLGALEVGKWIHKYCSKNGLLKKTNVCNALMEMYSKCGCVDQAKQLFDHMSNRNVISWSTMIAGLANHGKAVKAIDLFERMKQTMIQPNAITFIGLLSACSHAGLWREGLAYFDSMRREYDIEPEIEHYGSIVDLLGRVGRLHQALDMIQKMPMKPDAVIWGSLLSSCRTHCNLEIATIAMEHLSELEPGDTGNFVLLSNIYADLGKWDGVSRMRKLIRSRGMKKTPGCSLIEVENIVHEFASGVDSKPFSHEIIWLLGLIKLHGTVAYHADDALVADGAECLC